MVVNMHKYLLLLLVLMLPLSVLATELNEQFMSEALKEKVTAKEQVNKTPEEKKEEIGLIQAGSARDSPFYALDRALENLQLRLTKGHIAKAQLRLKFAEERLAEAKKLIEQNKIELAEATIDDYESELSAVQNEILKASELGEDVDEILQQVNSTTSKHTIVLKSFLEQAPSTANPAIMHALNVSQKGQEMRAEKAQPAPKTTVKLEIEKNESKEIKEPKPEKENRTTPNKFSGHGWH